MLSPHDLGVNTQTPLLRKIPVELDGEKTTCAKKSGASEATVYQMGRIEKLACART
jgi:hypothetical protein